MIRRQACKPIGHMRWFLLGHLLRQPSDIPANVAFTAFCTYATSQPFRIGSPSSCLTTSLQRDVHLTPICIFKLSPAAFVISAPIPATENNGVTSAQPFSLVVLFLNLTFTTRLFFFFISFSHSHTHMLTVNSAVVRPIRDGYENNNNLH